MQTNKKLFYKYIFSSYKYVFLYILIITQKGPEQKQWLPALPEELSRICLSESPEEGATANIFMWAFEHFKYLLDFESRASF